jgi:hypothetical protein
MLSFLPLFSFDSFSSFTLDSLYFELLFFLVLFDLSLIVCFLLFVSQKLLLIDFLFFLYSLSLSVFEFQSFHFLPFKFS